MSSNSESTDLATIDRLRRHCRYDEARQTANEALETGCETAELRILLGRIDMDLARPERAFEQFDRAVYLDQHSDHTHSWRIAALDRSFCYTDALERTQIALEQFPKSVPVLVTVGRLNASMCRFDDALQCFDKAYALDIEQYKSLYHKSSTLLKACRVDEAATVALEAIRQAPGDPYLLEALAYTQIEKLQYKAGMQTLDQVLKTDPYRQGAHATKIYCLRSLDRLEEAEEACHNALTSLPRAPFVLLEHAFLASSQNQDDTALERSTRAAEIYPEVPFIRRLQVTLLRENDQLGQADAILNELLTADQRTPTLLIERAKLRQAQGKFDEAFESVREAIKIDPFRPYAQVVEISLLRESGWLAEAEQAARDALNRLAPAGASIRNALIDSLQDQGRYEEALKECESYCYDDPYNVILMLHRIILLDLCHRYDEQAALTRDTQARFPEEPVFCYFVGLDYKVRSDYGTALVWMEHAVELASGYLLAWQNRASTLRLTYEYVKAEQVARAGLRALPCHKELHKEISLALSAQENYDDSVASLQDALRICPESSSQYLRRALTDEYLWQGREEEALLEIDRALQSNPGSIKGLLKRYDVLIKLRRLKEADELATWLSKQLGSNSEVLRKLGWRAVQLGHTEAALEYFRGNTVSQTTAVQEQVFALRAADRFDEAFTLLRPELEKDPDSRLLLVELARIHRAAGQFEKALQVARRAINVEPQAEVATWEEIVTLLRMRKISDAEEVACRAVERFPHDLSFVKLLGIILAETNRSVQSIAYFDQILNLEPLRSDIVAKKSSVLRKQRRYRDAELVVRSLLKHYPKDRTLAMEMGWVLVTQERFVEAEQHFSQLLEEAFGSGEYSETQVGVGWVAMQRDDMKKAEWHFRTALETDPRDDQTRLLLAATMLRSAGSTEYDEVERLCLDVLIDDSFDDQAYALLGVMNFRRENHAAAEYYLRTAVELDPYQGAHIDLAALYSQLGRFQEAEELLDQVVKRDWFDPQAHIELGNVYLQRDIDSGEPGQWSGRAVQQFRQVSMIAPGNGTAAIGLARSLVRASGDLVAAEEAVRHVLDRSDCDLPRWRLQVELARLLVQRGDTTDSEDLYLEALAVTQEAIGSASDQVEPYFVAGVAAYKVGESGNLPFSSLHFRRSVRYLRRVEKLEIRHSESHRVRVLAQQRIRQSRSSVVGSTALIMISMIMLVLLWTAFFLQYQVPTVLLGTLTPVLVAMVGVGFLLPMLVRLKLPGGLEADLSASLHQVSSGPIGEVSLGSGQLGGRRTGLGTQRAESGPRPASLSEGPRAELAYKG